MSRRSVFLACIGMILDIVSAPAVFADTIIVANDSSRTQQSNPDTNISDSSKLTVRTERGDPTRIYKSWVKFDISKLDVSSLETATLTVTLFQDRGGSCSFDVSYVNDDCLDNIGWERRSLTWNNAPGNLPAEAGALDPSKTTWLTRVEFANGVAGDQYAIDVLEALESDTDGIVQFVFHDSSAYMILCSHGHAEAAWRPSITAGEGPKGKAKKPSPGKGDDDVYVSPVLSWTPGGFADKHNVYFSRDFNDVNDGIALVGPGQNASTYEPGRLQFGETYFWRIDEVNAPPASTVFRGDVWSFTVESLTRGMTADSITPTASSSFNADTGPRKTVDGSGLNALDQHDTTGTNMWLSASGQQPPVWIQYQFDNVYKLDQMWVWNSNNELEWLAGLGVKTATIEYSTDATKWTALANVPQFDRAPGAPDYDDYTTVDFGGVAARFVRMTLTSNWGEGNQYGLSEVRFFHVSVVSARSPEPATGAMGVLPDTILSWRAGCEAALHQVYLGKDPNVLTRVDTVTTNSYTPADLLLGTQYYWRIDEVNTAETISTWTGDVWSFSTSDTIPVDDFESYKNMAPLEIWATWLDGTEFGTNDPTNGSIVGLDPAAGDYNAAPGRTGGQSLPIWFTNTAAAPKSEAIRTSTFGNWTAHGIKGLSLWFYGDPANSGGRLYVKINNSTPLYYDGDPADLAKASWQPFNIDLSKVGASLNSVTKLAVGVEGVGATGAIRVDDICLY